MIKSRLTRLEEERAKKRIITMLGASITLIAFLVILGPRILATISALLGNSSAATNLTGTDTTPPFPPVLDPLPDATNSARIVIRGYAEPESTIYVFLNNSEADSVLVDANGEFTIRSLSLKSGSNTLYINSKDQAGNVSRDSDIARISYGNNPPELTIESPEKDLHVTQEKITVSGKTNATQLTINGRFTSISEGGSFSHEVILQKGENTIIAIATDQAGNQTTTEQKITYD